MSPRISPDVDNLNALSGSPAFRFSERSWTVTEIRGEQIFSRRHVSLAHADTPICNGDLMMFLSIIVGGVIYAHALCTLVEMSK